MSFIELANSRRSIRKFTNNPIADEDVEQILEAMMIAPSAGNLQSRRFVFVTNKRIQRELAEASLKQMFIGDAPLVIVVCADLQRSAAKYGVRGSSLYALLDAAAAIQNGLLAIHDMGLGACWIGAFDEIQVEGILGLPTWLRPISIIPVGYPDENPAKALLLPPSDVVFYVLEGDND